MPDEIVDRFCLLGPPEDHVAELREPWKAIGVDQFVGLPAARQQGGDPRAYGETIIPALREHVAAKA